MVKILVVEDELIVALELKSRLYDLGYTVNGTVASGEEAIEETRKQNPDIILMDINIKGAYDGVQVAEIIKAEYDIPIIFITAFSDPKTLQRAKIIEPYGYIIKPFEERELHTAIEIALYKHNMEKKLRDSEKKLSITLKSISDAVIAAGKSGVINYLNPAAENLTGYTVDEAIGKSILEILNFRDQDFYKAADAGIKGLVQGDSTRNFPCSAIIVRKDGTEIIIEANAASIIDNNGNVNGIVLNFRDVSERKKMEEKLKIALGRAEESSKMKSIFLSNMSHEFRTPMIGILGIAQIIKNELPGSQNKMMIDMMIKSSNRLLTTLDSILEFSNFESGKVVMNLSEINVSDMVRNLVKEFEDSIKEKGLELKIFLEDKKLKVLGDEKFLKRALGNIIGNAVKFTSTGVVTLESGKILQQGREWITFEIADTGIGISKDKLNIIFDEFRQASEGTSRHYDGNGLGLNIARKIIEQMNGYITVESQIGKGSRFIIHFPTVTPGNGKSNDISTSKSGNEILEIKNKKPVR
jgi:hypothetical protein